MIKKNATIIFSLSVHCTDSENFFATESANLSKNTLNFPLTVNYSYCVIIKKVLKTIYSGNVYEIGKQLFELCIHGNTHKSLAFLHIFFYKQSSEVPSLIFVFGQYLPLVQYLFWGNICPYFSICS